MAENVIIHEISLSGYKATSDGMLDLGTWGSYGVEKLHCTFDEAWRELTITAFFNVKGEVVGKALVGKDGYADVPWEATKENTFAGRIVFEGSMNSQRRISANLNFKVTNHSEFEDSDPVPTDDRWNQFVTQNKEYRDGAYEAATKSEARAEDAEAASEDAQAAMRAAKEAAENAAADAAKAGPYAEAALAAQKAAEDARDKATAAQQAAENAAAAAAASKSAADTLAAEAARAALAAEESKAAANAAANLAGENATDAQQAAGVATAAANDAGQGASDAAASKAAAETAANVAQEAQAAAAAAKADAVKAQTAAQAAAKTAQDAQSAAEKAWDDAQTARKGAEAARDAAAGSAEAAEKSEENAKQSADTLAGTVEKVAANTAAVAELREKKAEIDDTAVGADAWSSKHIIDMLCPKIEESGNPVQCYPVAGYPLGVTASWEPVQKGEGEPSPENIRPIVGRNSVTVNLASGVKAWELLTLDGTEEWKLERNYCEAKFKNGNIPSSRNDLSAAKLSQKADRYSIDNAYATPTADKCAWVYSYPLYNFPSLRIKHTDEQSSLDNWKAYLAAQYAAGTPVQVAYKLAAAPIAPEDGAIYFAEQPAQSGRGDPSPTNIRPVLLDGAVKDGGTNVLTLPETVYGGEVDAVTGEGTIAKGCFNLDDATNWKATSYAENNDESGYGFMATYPKSPIAGDGKKCWCSHLPFNWGLTSGYKSTGILVHENGQVYVRVKIDGVNSVETWIAYLAAQKTAGTPVQACYKLEKPVPFTATGAQPIPALAGANTVLTDADSATVTGRADPIKRITDLEDAVASQT